MRHSARCDALPFYEVRPDGTYRVRDLNLPGHLPARHGGPTTFNLDPPITATGVHQAVTIGQAFSGVEGIHVKAVVASPAYRCVATAHNLLVGLGLVRTVPITVEAGLLENLLVGGNAPPTMTATELSRAGYLIDTEYRPLHANLNFFLNETSVHDLYTRHNAVVQHVLDQKRHGDIIIVGHAHSLDLATRMLCGNHPRERREWSAIAQHVGYCSFVQADRQPNGRFKIVKPCVPQYTLSDTPFNHECLLGAAPGMLARLTTFIEHTCPLQ